MLAVRGVSSTVDGALLCGGDVDGAQLDKLAWARNVQQRGALILGQHSSTGIERGRCIAPIFLEGVFQRNGRVGTSSQEDADDFSVTRSGGPAQGVVVIGMNIDAGSQQPADDFGMATGGGVAQGVVVIGMDVGACGQEDTNDVGMATLGGPAHGLVIIGMNIDTGSQQ